MEMIFKEDLGTGYMYCYNPSHCCSNKVGKVMEHVYVMWKNIGRLLNSDECVHHKDRDRKNNMISNLQLMTLSEHALLHAIEDKGFEYVELICNCCSSKFTAVKSIPRKYCSEKCSHKNRELFNISKEELSELVWSKSITEISKMFRVSDSCICKRCKKYGILRPGRGYWNKVHANKIL